MSAFPFSKLITTDQVLDVLPISPRTLAEMRSKHLIEYVQIGRKCMYKAAEVERLIQKFTVPAITGGLK